MSTTISTDLIHKLDDKILEIRIRALRDISRKLKTGLKLKNSLTFCPPELFKYSLFWFRQNPICEVEAVLKLMICLLQSEYGHQVVGHFGVARIKKEVNKIKVHLDDDDHLEMFNQIYEVLAQQQANDVNDISLSEKLSNMKLTSSGSKTSATFHDCDLVECWEIPEIVDRNNVKTIHKSLTEEENTSENYDNALNYLKTALIDWPAEFFLQPPYIFKTLLTSLASADPLVGTKHIQLLHALTLSLQGSKRSRQQAGTYRWKPKADADEIPRVQVSLNRFLKDTFFAAINFIKHHENIDQETLYESYRLMFELTNLLLLIKTPDLSAVHEILVELGYLVKMFRQSWLANAQQQHQQSHFVRTQYLVVLYLIASLFQNARLETDHLQTSKIFPYQPDYDAAAFASMATSRHAADHVWLNELYIAVLDFPLRDSHTELYKIILACIEQELSVNKKMVTILHARDVILPAINVLRQPHTMTDEELVYEGMRAIDTVYLHQSLGMARRLFEAITNLLGEFGGNSELRSCGESLYLRLLSTKLTKMKSLIYQLSADKFKDFFSCIVTGENSLKKSYHSISSYLALGIPLTTEILTEIICFGVEDDNTNIKNNAIIILRLLLKSKEFVGKYWQNVLEVLVPVLPLLQCLADDSELGATVIELFDPDTQNLSDFVLLQGNMRFLFARNPSVRDIAINRLLYLLSVQPDAAEYLPNTRHIAGSVPDSVCVNKTPIDWSRTLGVETYEEHAIHSLVQLLQTETIEPSMRHTVLLQLDLMVKNRRMCEIFHDMNGWAYCFLVLNECLKEDHKNVYPQSAQLAVGILAKLCLHIPSFRQFLSEETNFHYRLLRTVLIYHNSPAFKPDYTALMFMLTFDEYVIGHQLSVPRIFRKLYIPFVCNAHWITSPYDRMSALEEVLTGVVEEPPAQYRFEETQPEEFCQSFMCVTKQTPLNGDSSAINDHTATDTQAIWQYIRLTFAYFWFGQFDPIVEACKHNTDKNLKISYSNVAVASAGKNGERKRAESLDFDGKLRLTSDDLSLIKCTFVKEKTKHYLDVVRNATHVQQVLEGVCGISVAMLIPEFQETLDTQQIDAAVMKYIKVAPNNEGDEKVYVCVLKFLRRQIDAGSDATLLSMLTKLTDKHVVFVKLLKTLECSKEVYEENANFITNVIEKSATVGEMALKKQQYLSLLNDLFEETFKQLIDNFNRGNVDKVRVLTSLLKTLAMTTYINTDEGHSRKVVKALLNNISAIKSSSHVASNIYKNCLLCINFLVAQCKELDMKSKHIKLLSILSGHQNATIRALAWSTLAELANCVEGAHLVIKELAYLPGGIHACCLSTILDLTEITLVVSAATSLFVNLLQHRASDGSLHGQVAPMCKEKIYADSGPVAFLLEITKQQQLFRHVIESFDFFAVSDLFDSEENIRITNCDTVACYASIISALVDVDKSLAAKIIENRILIVMIDCLGYVPLVPNAASLKMVTEICNVLLRCIEVDSELVVDMVATNVTALFVLVHLLNLDHYDDFGDDLLISTTTSIMKVLYALASTDVGLYFIENTFQKIEFVDLIEFFNDGFAVDRQKYFQMTCMRLFVRLIKPKVLEPATEASVTFAQLLERHKVKIPSEYHQSDGGSETNEKIKKISQEFLNRCSDGHTNGVNGDVKLKRKHYFGSELLFAQLSALFDSLCDQDKPQNGYIVISDQKRACITTIQALLRTCPKVGTLARESKFIHVIIERLESVNAGIGGNCRDFIKKHGDSKKTQIIEEIILLTGIITNSAFTCPLTDSDADTRTVCTLIRLFSNLWSWASSNGLIEIAFLKCLSVISRDCVTVCKCLALQYQGVPHPILKLIITTLVLDTCKAKSPKMNFDSLKLGFAVLTNCCTCIEGRLLIVKMNALDVIDRLHPAVTKLQSPWDTATFLWLSFWERFSRYPEGAGVRHLSVLCALLRKNKLHIGTLALKVLRNMTFLPANRTALLASEDFVYVLKFTFDVDNYEQLFLVGTMIWKLVANSQKAKQQIKNSSIPRKMNECLKKLSRLENCEENDLYNVLKIIEQILDA